MSIAYQQNPSYLRRSPEAERALIECQLVNPEAHVPDQVPEWFTDSTCQIAAEAIIALRMRGEEIDPLTVSTEAKKKHDVTSAMEVAWQEMYTGAYNVFNYNAYAAILRNEYQLRQAIELTIGHMKAAIAFKGDSPESLIQKMITDLVELGTGKRSDRRYNLKEGIGELKALVEEIKSGKERPGFDFVLPSMRAACWGGLAYPGSVNLIGANPGVGKSMLLLTMAVWNAAIRGQRGIYIGTEMPIEMLMIRIAPMLAQTLGIEGVTPDTIESGECGEALDLLSELVDQRKLEENLIMFDSISAVETYLATIAAEKATDGDDEEDQLKFVVIDYIQMMSPEDSSRFKNTWAAAEYVCEAIRASAMRGNKFILVAASSFTKGGKKDTPGEERFRGVFKLAHDAGTMWAMWINSEMGDQLCIRPIKIRMPSAGWGRLDVDIPIAFDSVSGAIKELTMQTEPLEL